MVRKIGVKVHDIPYTTPQYFNPILHTPEKHSLTNGGRLFVVAAHASSAEVSKDDMTSLSCTAYGDKRYEWPV